jgi:GMP synthase (glutamine-hydrolysing)
VNELRRPIVLVVHNDDADPIGRLGDWLTAAGLDLYPVDGPDLPDTLDGFDALVVLGGAMGANDDATVSWLPHLKQLLRRAVTTELPTLAVCLGAQLLAVANGGTVVVSPDGPEIGPQLIAKRSAAATDPLFAAMPITPDVIQWHYDEISALPPGATHLANSPVCENQAFRLGRLAWGIQGHIETTPEVVRNWARADAEQLQDWDLDLVVSRSDAVHDDIAEVWTPFAEAFAAVVKDPAAFRPAREVQDPTAEPLDDVAALRAALAAEAGQSRVSPLGMPSMRPPWDSDDRAADEPGPPGD